MKRRRGFVSNSSSSSFILAVDKDIENCDLKIEISIENCIDKRISTIDEAQVYLMEEYCYSADTTFDEMLEEEGEWVSSRYDKMVEAIEDGKDIVVGTGSSEGDSAADLAIYYGALGDLEMDNVTVLENDGC